MAKKSTKAAQETVSVVEEVKAEQTVAEAAVEEVKKDVEVAEVVEAVAEAPKAEEAPVVKKAPAKKTTAKKPVKKAAEDKAEVKAEAKEEKPAKKPVTKKAEPKAEIKNETVVFVEYQGSQFNSEELLAKVKENWVAQGHRASSIKSLYVYIKPEEHKVFYVVNGKADENSWIWM